MSIVTSRVEQLVPHVTVTKAGCISAIRSIRSYRLVTPEQRVGRGVFLPWYEPRCCQPYTVRFTGLPLSAGGGGSAI